MALTSILEQLSSLTIVLFLRVFLLGMPSVLLYNFEAAILRADGDAQFSMQALCLSAVMNVVLDLLFIGVFGWGVVDSAIATDLCYTTIAVLLSVRLLHLDSPVRIDPHRLHVDRKSMRTIVQIGLPAGIQSAVFSIANIVIQGAINSLGTEVMAASSAGMNIEFVCYKPVELVQPGMHHVRGAKPRRPQLRAVPKDPGRVPGGGCHSGSPADSLRGVSGQAGPGAYKPGSLRGAVWLHAPVYHFPGIRAQHGIRGHQWLPARVGMSTPPAVTTTVVICGLRFFWIAVVFPVSHTFQTIMNIYPISLGLNCVCLIALLLILHPVRMLTKKRVQEA